MSDMIHEKCLPYLVPDYLLNSLKELMENLEQTAEMRGACSLTESKIMISNIIESLLEVALQSARIVSWSDNVMYLISQLREIIGMQRALSLVYANQMIQEDIVLQNYAQSYENALMMGDFQLSTLSRSRPELYNWYIRVLNDIITRYQTFKHRPLFAIAAQGVRIGRDVCTLASILYLILGMDEKAEKMRTFLCHFSVHIMIKPVVLPTLQIHKIDRDSEFKPVVWKHLHDSYGYDLQDLEFFSDYTIWVVEDPFENQGCAFAITNFDVTMPFTVPRDDTRIDFKYPYVVIQFLEVEESFKRCGFGTFLVNYLKRVARENNYETLCVDQCYMFNSLPFWKAMRFKPSKSVERWHEFELGH